MTPELRARIVQARVHERQEREWLLRWQRWLRKLILVAFFMALATNLVLWWVDSPEIDILKMNLGIVLLAWYYSALQEHRCPDCSARF